MVDRSFSAGASLNPGVAEHAGAHPDRVGAGRRARAVMVLGTSSGAGKSWLATALCRWYTRQGLRVAPFKAQNMSNNARVVSGIGALVPGGEIGSAQYFQALAAQARPDVRMNPLLLKPEGDTHSQVVLMGRVDRASPGAGGAVERRVAVVAFPHVSNLDEFAPLGAVPGLALSWVRTPSELVTLGPHDWIVLPGSKSTSHDLAWMRRLGLDHAVTAHAARGGPVLGICAGMQMLGEALIDPHGIDGNGPGLGLLPLVTEFAPDKTVRHTRAAFGAVQAPWRALSGLDVAGYEIHHGQTRLHPAMVAAGHGAHAVMAPDLAWQNKDGNVLGIYVHGLFEQPSVMQAMFGVASKTLDSVFDAMADCVQAHFEPGVLDALLQ